MRLAVLAPTLPAELAALLPLLARLDPPVLTSRSLLFTPAHALLQGLLETPRDGAARRTPRESALKQLQQAVRRAEAPPMILGTTAYDDELVSRRQRPGLSTGIDELDRLLSTVSNVIELSGPEGAGKTLLALHLAIRHLLAVPTARVLWVDSEGVFGAERALAVLQAINPSAPPETVLDRLEVRATFDLTTFGEVLASLEAQLSTAATSAASVSDLLLVVDPIDGLYGGGMATNGLETKATMVSDLHALSALSHRHGINVLLLNSAIPSITNSCSRLPHTRTKPALGADFTFLTQATLWLEEFATNVGGRAGERTLALQTGKNKTGLSGTLALFRSDGIALDRVHY